MSKVEDICGAIITRLNAVTVTALPYFARPAERFSPVTQRILKNERPAAFLIRGAVSRDLTRESDIQEIYTMDVGILVLVQPDIYSDSSLTKAEEVIRLCLNNEKLGGLAFYVEHRRSVPFTAENVLPVSSTLLAFEVGFQEDRTIPMATLP